LIEATSSTRNSEPLGASLGILSLVDGGRDRVIAATRSLFSHGPYPLSGTMAYQGDPGLFGPGSMTWPVVGDTSVFVGGIRALLVQAAHPEVVAGIAEHSRYREDPLGRLTRTSAYVTATSFGAMPEVERAVATVRRRHQPVVGRSHRDEPYDAADPGLAAWVHNSLTDSFLRVYRTYGSQPCSEADADRYVAEQARVGELLGAYPLPRTARTLETWINDHPALGPSPGQLEAIRFLHRPPLPATVRVAYGLLFRAAIASLPGRIKEIIGVRSLPGDLQVGRAGVAALRWSLGASPDWELALLRTGTPPPPGVNFRQPLPAEATDRAGQQGEVRPGS
jgi:uncharacterized protein (DUF2236 family)